MNGTEEDIFFYHNIGSNDKMSDSFITDSGSNEDFVGLEPNKIMVPPIFFKIFGIVLFCCFKLFLHLERIFKVSD